MNRMFRNVLFYLLLFVVIIGVIGVFTDGNEQAEEYNVKEFMTALNNGEIKEMTMQPVNKIMRFTGELNDDNKPFVAQVPDNTDRKSTRLNSSHVAISYAVFCLKKKKSKYTRDRQ